jgi:hypothetical protein
MFDKFNFNKPMLLIECPPWSDDGNTWIFRRMGFQIEGYYQLLCSELRNILDIRSKFRLENFDLVVICADTVVPRELLEQFRAEVQAAEAENSCPIHVVGMNLNLSGAEQVMQAEIYNGLFIGGDTTDEQIIEMFADLFSK